MDHRSFLKDLFIAGVVGILVTLYLNLHVDNYGSSYQLRLFGYINYCPQPTNAESGLAVSNHYNYGKAIGIRLQVGELNPNQPTVYMCIPHGQLFLTKFPGTEVHNE